MNMDRFRKIAKIIIILAVVLSVADLINGIIVCATYDIWNIFWFFIISAVGVTAGTISVLLPVYFIMSHKYIHSELERINLMLESVRNNVLSTVRQSVQPATANSPNPLLASEIIEDGKYHSIIGCFNEVAVEVDRPVNISGGSFVLIRLAADGSMLISTTTDGNPIGRITVHNRQYNEIRSFVIKRHYFVARVACVNPLKIAIGFYG